MIRKLDFDAGHLATSYKIPRHYLGVSMARDHEEICLWLPCTDGEESSEVQI